jgi:hypothetical protein
LIISLNFYFLVQTKSNIMLWNVLKLRHFFLREKKKKCCATGRIGLTWNSMVIRRNEPSGTSHRAGKLFFSFVVWVTFERKKKKCLVCQLFLGNKRLSFLARFSAFWVMFLWFSPCWTLDRLFHSISSTNNEETRALVRWLRTIRLKNWADRPIAIMLKMN